MKSLMRLNRGHAYLNLGVAGILSVGVWGVVVAPVTASAQAPRIAHLHHEHNPFLLFVSSQGYLGVDLADVDNEKAQALKLKEARGAVITLIDHDAPAGQIGLKVNDVVLQLNGQTVESSEQLRRMLKEIPAGRKVTLLICRDGNPQTLTVELADRKAMEQEVWNKIGSSNDGVSHSYGLGIFSGVGNGSLPGGFHLPFFGNSLNVGALVEPLTSQMAEYLGVPSGLMVKQVAHKSAADAAGLKAFDVILKVGPDTIATSSDWERSLHANQGKQVQVLILRDKKQQTVTLLVDSKRHQSDLEMEEICPTEEYAQLAPLGLVGSAVELASQTAQSTSQGDTSQSAQDQGQTQTAAPVQTQEQILAQTLLNQLQSGGNSIFTPQLAEELLKQVRKQQQEANAQSLSSGLQIDSKQFDQLKQQMEALRKSNRSDRLQLDRKQMEDLKRQMDELKALNFGNQI
jgi:serine protease Do